MGKTTVFGAFVKTKMATDLGFGWSAREIGPREEGFRGPIFLLNQRKSFPRAIGAPEVDGFTPRCRKNPIDWIGCRRFDDWPILRSIRRFVFGPLLGPARTGSSALPQESVHQLNRSPG